MMRWPPGSTSSRVRLRTTIDAEPGATALGPVVEGPLLLQPMSTMAIRAASTATAARLVRDFLFMTDLLPRAANPRFADVAGNNGVGAPSFGREGRT